MKRLNEQLKLKIKTLAGQLEALEKDRAKLLDDSGGIGKKLIQLEQRNTEYQDQFKDLTSQLARAKREGRESATSAMILQMQVCCGD